MTGTDRAWRPGWSGRARIANPLLHPAVAVVLTWPAVLHLGTALPRGTESVATVPLFNLWTLEWNVDRVGHAWSGYWTAPIFAPDPGSFARSDPQPLTGLVAWFLSWLPGGAATAYVLVLLLALTLNGITAARVARRLGASAAGAAIAGVMVQSSPFVTNELGVLQLTVLVGGFLAIEGVVDLAMDGPSRRAGYLAGGGLAVAALTNGYLMLALATVLGPITLVLLRSRRPAATAAFVLAGLLPLAAAAPFVLGQQAATDGQGWSTATVEANSAELVDLVQLDDQIEGGRVLPWAANTSGTAERLWPGALVVGLGSLGLVDARRRKATRRAATVLGFVALFGIVASLGLRLDLAGFHPYGLLRDHVPGWDRLRSPFRLMVLVTLALGPLVGPGFDRLVRLLRDGAHRRVGPAVLAAVLLAGAWEVWPNDRPLADVPDVATLDWVGFLRDVDDAHEPVANVPAAAPRGRVGDFEATVVDMLAALEHGHPMVSGYTGLFPDDARTVRRLLQAPVGTDAVDVVCTHQAGWLVIDDDLAVADDRLELAFDGEARDVYRVACAP